MNKPRRKNQDKSARHTKKKRVRRPAVFTLPVPAEISANESPVLVLTEPHQSAWTRFLEWLKGLFK